MSTKNVQTWLLGTDEPSIRYLALTKLMGKPDDDPEVEASKELIGSKGWASDILTRQRPSGAWESEENLYQPKYLSTNWMLLILADLGLTKTDPRIAKACELWIERFAAQDGGFGISAKGGSKTGHHCTTGNMARALVQFGYANHPRVRSAFEWLVKTADKNGGWSCFGRGRNLDSWEGMSAFASYPRPKWTEGMKRTVEAAAEFYLQRELHLQGAHYEPWYRFHYPVHYYYDLLVGLDFMTALGYVDDPRLAHAISHLSSKQRSDGRWNLDAIHPDLEGGTAEWYSAHPDHAPTPFALETVGKPSKMVTLRAEIVRSRLDGVT